MNPKFSLESIIKDFCKFYNEEWKILVLYPIIISIVLAWFIQIDMELINVLLFAVSIFIGFLLNLMLMSFNLKDDNVQPIEYAGKLWGLIDFLEEYQCTISFEILITIFLVVLMLFTALFHKSISLLIPDMIWILKIIFNFLLIYFLIVFLLLLIRLLKLGHIFLKYYIKN